MKENNEENLISEHIKKIKYRMGYQINETPKYKPIIEDDAEFDEFPQEVYATQDGFPVPNVGGSDAYLEEDKEELPDKDMPAEPTNTEAPQEDDVETPEQQPIDLPTQDSGEIETNTEIQTDTDVETPEELPTEEPSNNNEVDKIQNDIIRHNIEAMKNLQSKLEDLENINNSLNNQLTVLNHKVKEVEEPTSAEKLMKQKENSYPFYFNLNDVWKNNWFQQERNSMNEKGIRELPDGTFIADFDDLNTHNDMDIDDSFNDII